MHRVQRKIAFGMFSKTAGPFLKTAGPFLCISWNKPKSTKYSFADVNLAFEKPAKQSSNFTEGYSLAKNAVDGNLNNIMFDQSCTHTKEGHAKPQWWQVDLQKEYLVKEIVITNRGDCCGKLNNFGKLGNHQKYIQDGCHHDLRAFPMMSKCLGLCDLKLKLLGASIALFLMDTKEWTQKNGQLPAYKK